MLARYYDPATETVREQQVEAAVDVDSVIKQLARTTSDRGSPALELSRGDGSALVVAPTPIGSVLLWTDSLGTSFHSVGESTGDGTVIFDYFGSYTEVPEIFVIPTSTATAAATAYVQSGSPTSASLSMEPD